MFIIELIISVTSAQTSGINVDVSTCMIEYKFKYQLSPKKIKYQLNTNEQV